MRIAQYYVYLPWLGVKLLQDFSLSGTLHYKGTPFTVDVFKYETYIYDNRVEYVFIAKKLDLPSCQQAAEEFISSFEEDPQWTGIIDRGTQ